MTTTPREIARHEAAHAIVAAALGVKVTWIRLRRRREFGGGTRIEDATAIESMIVAAAGVVCEMAAAGLKSFPIAEADTDKVLGAAHDLDKMFEMMDVEGLPAGGSFANAVVHADAILAQSTVHWGRLTDLLVTKRDLVSSETLWPVLSRVPLFAP